MMNLAEHCVLSICVEIFEEPISKRLVPTKHCHTGAVCATVRSSKRLNEWLAAVK